MAAVSKSAVPDVLASDLAVVFVGINPGFHSDAKAAHFANPRNDFWRLLHAAGFTPRLVDPSDQFEVLRYGIGITNAAYRTTRGSSDLRKGDFAGSAERLERLALALRPRAIGFVGKEAYRGPFGGRPQHGLQERRLGDTALFVLPSTSPANAAVPWEERLHWFRALFLTVKLLDGADVGRASSHDELARSSRGHEPTPGPLPSSGGDRFEPGVDAEGL